MNEPRFHADKSTWGDGPWQTEPDKLVWIDDATDLDCMVRRGPGGQWCGYVGVDRTHPWYGKGYMDDAVENVEVHGGVTYADACNEDIGICHIPEPGRSGDLWWFGFDCAHAWDYAPAMEARMRAVMEGKELPDAPVLPGSVYRDMAYVQAETRHLAEQLAVVVTQPAPPGHSDCHSTGDNPPSPPSTR